MMCYWDGARVRLWALMGCACLLNLLIDLVSDHYDCAVTGPGCLRNERTTGLLLEC
jgi:hypothetical protein